MRFFYFFCTFLCWLSCTSFLHASAPLEGGAINFQGMLVDAAGIPVGAETEETHYMQFSIVSKEPGFIAWVSGPMAVIVRDGIFSVRLGKFKETQEALDENIFSGNDDGDKKRYLKVEICISKEEAQCIPYIPAQYRTFSQKSLDPNLEGTDPQAQVQIPGVPFIVSAIRIVGDDTKEGTLRLSKDEENPSTEPDLLILSGGSLNGMKIIQNQNMGIFIRQTESGLSDAFITKGQGIIRGSVYLKGNSDVLVRGDLSATHSAHGTLAVSSEGVSPGVQAGPVRSPSYASTTSKDYTVSTTGLSILNRLHILNIRQGEDETMKVKIDSKGENIIQIDEGGEIQLSQDSRILIQGNGKRILETLSPKGTIQALGFYDNENKILQKTSPYPYQAIFHGLSTFNTLTFSDSKHQLNFERLRGLIGTYDPSSKQWNSLADTFTDPGRTNTQLHRHDMRTGADAASMVQKLNEEGDVRIIRRRVDPQLAYLYENNDGISGGRPYFSKTNYFEFEDPERKLPSVATNDRIIARADDLRLSLGGDTLSVLRSDSTAAFTETVKEAVVLSTDSANLNEFSFLDCSLSGDCTQSSRYLDIHARRLSLKNSLNVTATSGVENSLQLVGSLLLRADGLYPTNIAALHLDPGYFTESTATPFIHTAQETTIGRDLVLSKSPKITTTFTLTGGASARDFRDLDNPNGFWLDPSANSRIHSLQVAAVSQVQGDLLGVGIQSAKSLEVQKSFSVSQTLTSNRFLDSDDPTFFLDPWPVGALPGKLKTLQLKNSLSLEKDASVARDLITSSDFTLKNNLTITNGAFQTALGLTAGSFTDLDQTAYYFNPDQHTNLNNLALNTLEAEDVFSTNPTRTLSVAMNLTQKHLIVKQKTITPVFKDKDNPLKLINPNETSRIHSLNTRILLAKEAAARSGATFQDPSLVSQNFTLSSSLEVSSNAIHHGKIEVIDSSVSTRFLADSYGRIQKAGDLHLSEGFHLSSPDSKASFSLGLHQQSQSGVNTLANLQIHSPLSLFDSSFAVGIPARALLAKDQAASFANASLMPFLQAGSLSFHQTLLSSAPLSTLKSDQTTLTLKNFALNAPLNLFLKNLKIEKTLKTDTKIQTQKILHKTSSHKIDPSSITSLHSLTAMAHSPSFTTGGSLILHSTLAAKKILDQQDLSLSLDPSANTTLSFLHLNSLFTDLGAKIHTNPTQTPLQIFDFAPTNDLLALENDRFLLKSQTAIDSKGNVDISKKFQLFSDSGLVFTSHTASVNTVNLTRQKAYLLAGKSSQYADTLHQHSIAGTHPLTDLVRRDVYNHLYKSQIFTSPTSPVILMPSSAPASKTALLLQKNSDAQVASLLEDGSLIATSLQGDATFLLGATGADIVDSSVTKEDFSAFSLKSSAFASNSADDRTIAPDSVSGEWFLDLSIGSEKIKDKSIQTRHFSTASLFNSHFQSAAVLTKHLALRAITPDLITSSVIGNEKIQNLVISTDKIALDAIHSTHIQPDAIRNYHFTNDSADSTRFASASLNATDLASMSIDESKIASLQVSSRVISDASITKEKILSSSIHGLLIQTHTLQNADLSPKSITKDKIAGQSLTSREISDFTLRNEDFQDLAIATIQLQAGSVRKRHLKTSTLDSSHFPANAILTENIAQKTILSTQIMDLSLQNQDFLTNSLSADNLATHSILSSHIQNSAITRDKINPYGIQESRFQPLIVSQRSLQALTIVSEHIPLSALSTLHVKNHSIQSQDLKTASLQAQKIKDRSLLAIHIKDHSLSTQNLLDNSVKRDKILSFAIENLDIQSSVLQTRAFLANSIFQNHIATKTLLTTAFEDNSVALDKFAPAAITTTHLIDFSLHQKNFAPQALSLAKFAPLTIETRHFFPKTIENQDIADFSIQTTHVAPLQISESKITTNTLSSRLFTSDLFSRQTFSPEKIQNRSLADNSLASFSIASFQLDSRVFLDHSLLGTDIKTAQISTRILSDNSIDTQKILSFDLDFSTVAHRQITQEKIKPASLTQRIFQTGAIVFEKIAKRSLDERVVLDFSILSSHIQTGAITASKLKSSIITSGHIVDFALKSHHFTTGFVKTDKIADDSLHAFMIATKTISQEKFIPSALGTSKISSRSLLWFDLVKKTLSDSVFSSFPPSLISKNTLSSEKIKDESIETQKIKPLSLSSLLLQDQAISEEKIASSFLTKEFFKPLSLTTEDFRDHSIHNENISDFIIESSHIIDGSLFASDVKTRSLPGTKFVSKTIQTAHIKDEEITAMKVMKGSLYGKKFQNSAIVKQNTTTGFLTQKSFANQSISSEKIAPKTITAAHLGNHFFLDANSLAPDSIPSSLIASFQIRPGHFSQPILADKISSLQPEDFSLYHISKNKIANASIVDSHIKSSSLYASDLLFVYTNTSGDLYEQRRKGDVLFTLDTNLDSSFPMPLDFHPGGNDFFCYANGPILYKRRISDGGGEVSLYDFSLGGITNILEIDWIAEDQFHLLVLKNDSSKQRILYDSSIPLITPYLVSLQNYDFLSATEHLGVNETGQLLFSSDDTFVSPVVITQDTLFFKQAVFLDSTKIFAVAKKDGGDLLMMVERSGNFFSMPKSLNSRFLTTEMNLHDLYAINSPQKMLVLLASAPPLSPASIFVLDENARGAKIAKNPPSLASTSRIAFKDYGIFSPLVAAHLIQGGIISDATILKESIQDGAITSQDIEEGAIREDHLALLDLEDSDFAPGVLTKDKFKARSLPAQKLETASIDNPHIATASLDNRVIAQDSFENRHISFNIFSSAFVEPNTLGTESIRAHSFSTNFLKNDLGSLDFHTGILLSRHLHNLTSAAIEDFSVNARKLKPAIFENSFFNQNALQRQDLSLLSFGAEKFLTNSFEGSLLVSFSLGSQKILTSSLVSRNLTHHAIQKSHLPPLVFLSSHLAQNALTRSNLEVSVVSRTLASSSVTTRSLDFDSFTAAQFQTGVVKAASIQDSSLKTALLADTIFTGDFFASNSIDSQKTQTLDFKRLRIATIPSADFTPALSLPAQVLVSASLQNPPVSMGERVIMPQSLKKEHFRPLGILSEDIASNAFSNDHLMDGVILARHLSLNSVNANSLASSAITSQKIIPFELLNQKFKPFDILNVKVADQSISTQKILSFTLQNEDFSIGSITEEKIKDFSLQNRVFQTGSVSANKIVLKNLTGLKIQKGSLFARVLADLTLSKEAFFAKTLTDDLLARNTIQSAKILDSGLNAGIYAPESFDSTLLKTGISGIKIADQQIEGMQIDSQIDSLLLSDATLSANELADFTITSDKIKDDSFSGSAFETNSIGFEKMKDTILSSSHFEDSAFTKDDFQTALNLTTKISLSADLSTSKILDGSIHGVFIHTALTQTNPSLMAANTVSEANLHPAIQFETRHVVDGALSGDKIKDGVLSGLFVADTLDSTHFSPAASPISQKIAEGAVRSEKIATQAITIAKLSGGVISNDAIQNQSLIGEDFENLEIVSAKIENASVTKDLILSSAFITLTHLPILHASKFTSVSHENIDTAIFNPTHFQDGIIKARHFSSLKGDRIADLALDGSKIADLSLGRESLSDFAITTQKIALQTLSNSEVADSVITTTHLKEESIEQAHFQNQTLTSADFDKTTLDQLFSGADVDAQNHQHSPFTLMRQANGYTLLDASAKGRYNFSYKIQNSATYDTASQNCATENAQVCDLNQLIEICSSGTNLNDDFYFAANPSLVSTYSAEYLIYPMTKFTAGSCFSPQLQYDFAKTQAWPVYINGTTQLNVRDLFFYNNQWFVKTDNFVYHSADGLVLDSSQSTNSDQSGASDYAHFVLNPQAGSERLHIFSDTKILKVDDTNHNFTQSAQSYTDIKDLAYYKYTDGGSPGGVVINDENSLALVDNNGDLISGAEVQDYDVPLQQKIHPPEGSGWTGWGAWEYKNIGNFNYANGKTQCEGQGAKMISIHSQKEQDFVVSTFCSGTNCWLGLDDSSKEGLMVWQDGTNMDFTNWNWGEPNDSGGNEDCANLTSSLSYKWNDISCANIQKVVCKRDLQTWGKRYQHATTVHNNQIFMIGGSNHTGDYMNDIWYSDGNGENWERIPNPLEAGRYTKLLLHGEADNGYSTYFTDSSSFKQKITGFGDVQHKTSQKKFGNSSIAFDGTGDYLAVEDGANSEFGTGDWTIDFWLHSKVNYRIAIFSKSIDNDNRFVLAFDGSGDISLYQRPNSTIANIDIMWNTNLRNDQWYHIALVRYKDDYILFVDGTSQGSVNEPNDPVDFASPLYIGKSRWYGDTYFKGYIDEFRFSKGIARWTTNFTPPTKAYHEYFSPRHGHQILSFNSQLWVIGGNDGAWGDDLYSSSDNGATWTQHKNIGFGNVRWIQAQVWNGAMWVLGGSDTNQVWKSDATGTHWTRQTNALWSGRSYHRSTVFNNKLYVSGGRSLSTEFNDVWYTSDGTNWTQASVPPWATRYQHAFTGFTHKGQEYLAIFGGVSSSVAKNDIWISTDGENWVSHGSAASTWGSRYGHTALSFLNSAWILGGYTGAYNNDVWLSTYEGYQIQKAETRKFFSAESEGYNHFVLYYSKPNEGDDKTHVRAINASNSSLTKKEDFTVGIGDCGISIYCAGVDACYVSTSGGDIHQIKATTPGGNYNPNWSLTSDFSQRSWNSGGASLFGKKIVHMLADDAASRTLYLLSENGSVYSFGITAEGLPQDGVKISEYPLGYVPESGKFERNKARIFLKDNLSNEISFTGPQRHIINDSVHKSARSACCQQTLY